MSNASNVVLQKFLIEGNAIDIQEAFDKLIQTYSDADISSLRNIDKFCILCKLRSMSFGDTLELVTASGGSLTTTISKILYDVSAIDCSASEIITIRNTDIELNLPHSLYVDTQNAVNQSFYKIRSIILSTLSAADQEKILSTISARTCKRALSYIKETTKKFSSTFFIPPVPAMDVYGISINPFTDSLYRVLCIMYREDLLSLYKAKYTSMTKLHTSGADYDNLAPAETRIFLGFYNEELELQNKQLKESQK